MIYCNTTQLSEIRYNLTSRLSRQQILKIFHILDDIFRRWSLSRVMLDKPTTICFGIISNLYT
jgi:hypothetical protein